MTINHRAEAEKHLAEAARHLTEHPADMRIAEVSAAIGQGHATLARDYEQTATTADQRDATTLLRRRNHAMRELIATHVVAALASKDANRQKAALHLASDLNDADANVDDLLNERLRADGWAPASAAPAYDPWAPKPDIAVDTPEPVRRVLAGLLVEMLLDGNNDDVRTWARGITYELKREGLDLGDAIKKRITDITLGADPADPPF